MLLKNSESGTIFMCPGKNTACIFMPKSRIFSMKQIMDLSIGVNPSTDLNPSTRPSIIIRYATVRNNNVTANNW